jgi:hypothetical protein
MPWTEDQKQLFGRDLERAKSGHKTVTGMTQAQLEKALHEPTKPSKPAKKSHA